MKITKTRLKQIIREELISLSETWHHDMQLPREVDPVNGYTSEGPGPEEEESLEWEQAEGGEDWDDYFEEEPGWEPDPLLDRYTPGPDEDIFQSLPMDDPILQPEDEDW